MNDTQTLLLIAKDSPKLLAAVGVSTKISSWFIRGEDDNLAMITSIHAAALVGYAMVMDLWEKEGVELTIPNRDITAYRVCSARRMCFDNLKDTPFAALYAAWLAKGPGESDESN